MKLHSSLVRLNPLLMIRVGGMKTIVKREGYLEKSLDEDGERGRQEETTRSSAPFNTYEYCASGEQSILPLISTKTLLSATSRPRFHGGTSVGSCVPVALATSCLGIRTSRMVSVQLIPCGWDLLPSVVQYLVVPSLKSFAAFAPRHRGRSGADNVPNDRLYGHCPGN